MHEQPAIETQKLSKLFGALAAIEDLDLRVQRGESVALFGPNGAGKTTLLRILTLGLRPSSGTLRLDGLDPRSDERRIRLASGVISHRTLLYDELTARENLLFFGRLHGVTRPAERADALLETVGLAGRADDPVKTFSAGMQQRLSLARCLIHDPRLVYLDEPFSGLDPAAGRMLRRTLERLRSEGRTVLLVTHNLQHGLELSDRWILLDRGRLVDQGVSRATDPRAFESTYHERLGHRTAGARA